MILVRKPAVAPQRLNLGVALAQSDAVAFDAQPQAYIEGQEKFVFDQTIYGHASVRRALEVAQHKKCCYCEGRFSGHSPGDIEHYRPKDGVQQQLGEEVERPGYYWLAYSWHNLFYSCPECNRSYKRRLFPLINPQRRARNHADELSAERPLILDPGGPEDPRTHIRFHKEIPLGTTRRGKETVKAIKLDREVLNENRRTYLHELERLKKTVALLQNDERPEAQALANEATALLEKAVLPEAIFSAMAQDLLEEV